MTETMRKLTRVLAIVGVVSLLQFVACRAAESPRNPVAPVPVATPSPDQIIALGDIDAHDPVKKIKRFQPLADYLADQLRSSGIRQGRVVIARDIKEMVSFLNDGTVDIYFDSAFPTLAVQELSGSQIIGRRWKQEDPTYWSTYVALRDNGIGGVEDFAGRVLAFEEPYSTSG